MLVTCDKCLSAKT